jgi:CHAT domain-containing protein
VSERNRARSLLEILTKAGVDLRSGADGQFLERQQRLNNKTASPRYAALTQPQSLSAAEIQQQILDKDTMLLEYALGTERSWLWAVTPETITSYELPKRDEIETAARRVYELLTARNRREAGETAAQRRVRVTQAEKDYPQAAADLSRMLLAPVAAHLGRKRLLIVTEGALQFIPFAALPETVVSRQLSVVSKQRAVNRPPATDHPPPLIVNHEIITLPSASTLAVLRRETAGRRPAPGTLAVLADPVFSAEDERVKMNAPANGKKPDGQSAPLPKREVLREVKRAIEDLNGTDASLRISRLSGTRWEAQQILSHVAPGAGMKALDFAASRATAISPNLSKYRILHFATHALINNQHPELSGIVLSLVDEQGRAQDGFLRTHEIYHLKLPAELVVLSGCQTGLGKEIRGEGLVGLTRGFMYAGAARVLVSLWSLDDRATAELMKQFYKRMLGKEQMTPAAALRAAQVAMWNSRQWQPPYYWAAFTLQGEWK